MSWDGEVPIVGALTHRCYRRLHRMDSNADNRLMQVLPERCQENACYCRFANGCQF